MSTTLGQLGVAPDAVEEDLRVLLLSQRDGLSRAGNNQPKAPSSVYVANVLRDIGQGKAQPIRMLLAVLRTNLRDGVSLYEVRKFVRRLDAALEVAANPRAEAQCLSTLNRMETRAECAENLAQLAAERDAGDPETLAQLIDACTQDIERTERLRAWAELRRAAVLTERSRERSREQRHLHLT
jgi:hypothetical protein